MRSRHDATSFAEVKWNVARVRGSIGNLLFTYFALAILVSLWALLRGNEFPFRRELLEFALCGLTALMMASTRTTSRVFRIDRMSLIMFLAFGAVARLEYRPPTQRLWRLAVSSETRAWQPTAWSWPQTTVH